MRPFSFPALLQPAAGIKVRAERRAGEMLKATERRTGGHAMKALSNDATEVPPTLSALGITRDQSSRWQQVAQMRMGEEIVR